MRAALDTNLMVSAEAMAIVGEWKPAERFCNALPKLIW